MARRRKIEVSQALRIMFLIVCFPAGLMVMWSDRCRWSRWVKMLVSAAVALALIAILLPQTTPPDTPKSGITIVGMAEDKETYGPEVPANRLQVEVYSPRYTALIIKADPTPTPRFVYCNQGGKYYHRMTCRYVTESSGAVTNHQALHAGYTPCPECDPGIE